MSASSGKQTGEKNGVGTPYPDALTQVGQPHAPAPSLPPDTTHQQDVNTAGQRKISMIWEVTQAVIALLVVLANMIVGVYRGLGGGAGSEHPVILTSSLFLVIGFYFSRTNHSAIGGIGPKPTQQYVGR